MNRYFNPVQTYQGVGSLAVLPQILEQMGLEKKTALIIAWGASVFEHPVFSQLEKFSIEKMVFTASNPTVEELFDTYVATKDHAPEVVVAIGGGSIMDVGKSLCCLYQKDIMNVDALRACIQNKRLQEPCARWIGVPTTSGTGSEVTCWATIWDPKKNVKRSVDTPKNYAYAAIVDPELTRGMPLSLATSSALDAVAHAVEAYWARATNVVSQGMALHAIRTIMTHIDGLADGRMEAYDAMAKGSMLAGMAFSNTKTTACHSISYPLTMRFNIPHGVAVSMLLAPVLALNSSRVAGLDALLAALGVHDEKRLETRIRRLLVRAGFPATLKDWGIRIEDCARLATLGMTKGRADNNPVDLTVETIREILESIHS